MVRCVVTGGPCTGKTTTIGALKNAGFTVVPEAARLCIERLQRDGKTVTEIFSDLPTLERLIVAEQIAAERCVATDEHVFFDRGLFDVEAYMRDAGLPLIDEAVDAFTRAHYDVVCVLETVPYVRDAVRVEDSVHAARLHQAIVDIYTEYGMKPVRVPYMSVAERVTFIRNLCRV